MASKTTPKPLDESEMVTMLEGIARYGADHNRIAAMRLLRQIHAGEQPVEKSEFDQLYGDELAVRRARG